MAKLIEITGKALSGEWGLEDKSKTGIPVLRTTNFTNFGIINYGDVITRNITKKNISEKFLRKGDIIIEKSGGSDKQPVGRVVLFNGEENRFLFNNFTGVLRVKDHEKWVPDYVFYALFANYRNGGTRKYENKTTGLHNLKTDLYINKYEIEWVNITEQKNVCATLRKIESIISDMNKEITYLDNLIKARFVEMFKDEDPVFAFDDVLIDDTKNGFKLDSSNYSNLGKIAIVDQGQKRICGYINAVDGKAPWSKEAIIFGDHTEMFKYINFPFYLGADGAKLLSPKNGWNARFLYHYLDVNYHKRLGYMRHFKYLKEMSFIKPDLYRQEEFCMFCTQVDKSKFALSNELAMGNFYIRLIHDCIMHGCIDL